MEASPSHLAHTSDPPGLSSFARLPLPQKKEAKVKGAQGLPKKPYPVKCWGPPNPPIRLKVPPQPPRGFAWCLGFALPVLKPANTKPLDPSSVKGGISSPCANILPLSSWCMGAHA